MKAYDSTKRHEAGCGHGCCFLEGHLGEKNKHKTRRVQKKRERTLAKDMIRIEASTEEGSQKVHEFQKFVDRLEAAEGQGT